MTKKDRLHAYCLALIDQRIRSFQEEIKLVQASANEETKSSAGDKYETARAMAQLEIERFEKQLGLAEKQRNKFRTLSPVLFHREVMPGALVTTTQGNYYLSASLGIVTLENQSYYCLSADAPLSKCLLGKKKNDDVSFNGKLFTILSVE